MNAPMRLLFTRGAAAPWRVGFDLAQASAALDVPMELAFAGAGLELIMPRDGDAGPSAVHGSWASLELLGVERVFSPAPCPPGFDFARTVLPVCWLDADPWRDWLRQAPLQGW